MNNNLVLSVKVKELEHRVDNLTQTIDELERKLIEKGVLDV